MPHAFSFHHHPARTTSARPVAQASPRRHSRISLLLVIVACLAALSASISLMAPALARSLADSLPASWIRLSAEAVLDRLDNEALSPSQVPETARQQLREHFATLTAPASGAPPYRLIFRASSNPDVLLLTLPSGDIVVTDSFFRRVDDAGVRLALLCHELGHLHHRHTLRNAVEHNLVWLGSAAFVGNAKSSVRALTHGLLATRYSEAQIEEAHNFARNILRANGLNPEIHDRHIHTLPPGATPAAFKRQLAGPTTHH